MTLKAQRAQPSRKGKKAWRKNVDVEDVESGLESMRAEERVRGTAEPISDDLLFKIDTTGDEKVKKHLTKIKPLRVEEILAERSAVRPPTKRRQGDNASSTESKHENEKTDRVAKRKKLEKEGKLPAPVKKQKKVPSKYDLWADDETESETKGTKNKVQKKRLSAKPVAAVYQSPVAVPAAGASYNPTFEDHQELLSKAHQVEVKRKKIQDNLQRLSDAKLPGDNDVKVAEEPEEKDNEDEEGEEDEANDIESSATGERKTRAQRNKEKRIKALEFSRKTNQQRKEQLAEVSKIADIKAEMETESKKQKDNSEQREANKMEKLKQGKIRLSKLPLQEPLLEIQLQDELSESLRQLKPEGHLLRDRFASFKMRNIIEHRTRASRKTKYKRKEYEKHSYKQYDRMEELKEQKRLR